MSKLQMLEGPSMTSASIRQLVTRDGIVAFVDENDFTSVCGMPWLAGKNGQKYYVYCHIKRKRIFLHRFLLKATPGQIVDHINRNPLDNRRANLRFATARQNALNADHALSASGYRGVTRGKVGWRVRIRLGDKRFTKDGFHSVVEAALVYDDLASEYHGDFAVLNFPGAGRQNHAD